MDRAARAGAERGPATAALAALTALAATRATLAALAALVTTRATLAALAATLVFTTAHLPTERESTHEK